MESRIERCQHLHVLPPFNAQALMRPADWDVDPSQARDFGAIVTELRSISLANGENFNQLPAITPNQHIHRSKNKAWRKILATQSKLLVDGTWRHNGLRKDQGSLAPTLSWWSSCDLLGLLLSAMGPAPDGATEKNFYLPLLALYGRWCHRISGNRGVNGRSQAGAGDPAFVYQCTWNEATRGFFLGASLSGYVCLPFYEVGQWETAVKTARFNLLSSFYALERQGFSVNGTRYPWRFGSSVNIIIDRTTGNQFGNCAETYPFLCMMG
ncbi:hypothetical protein OCS_06362 [Ophiocordyceps sinensis CO18]|uniref:Uncharacterized protein n=1 Tax=Ophiocordyceps sinensis (strain Co18 / CGMCC 3.14243) TaxID=911162 RepID=T5A697_OPHSC|nr:hypothetical protein OCS_06362 [Ophiocordyceps sinensis CO18]